MITQGELDTLANKYETEAFINDDPISIPKRYSDKKDIEIAGFISSLVAYGRRDVFIKKLKQLMDIAQNEPYNFIINFEPKILGNFNYRFGKPNDFAQIFEILKNLYKNDGGLEELFKYGYTQNLQFTSPQPSPKIGEGAVVSEPPANCTNAGEHSIKDNKLSPLLQHFSVGEGAVVSEPLANCTNAGEPSIKNNKLSPLLQHFSVGEGAVVSEPPANCTNAGEVKNMFIPITDYFYSRAKNPNALGFKFMIPDARKGSAMKRMCMYLRWMVRKGEVDFGIWDFMPMSDLLIPLDTHVARISRQMGLLKRNANDFKAVIELTESLKHFDPKDPIKYDFAIFGYGVNNN